MTFLGEGAQYFVFSTSDSSRVLKVPKTEKEVIQTYSKRNELYQKGIGNKYYRQEDMQKRADARTGERAESLEIIKSIKIDPSLLGNPVFDGEAYTQDKMVPLGDYLEECVAKGKVSEAKSAVKDYSEFNWKLWNHGIADKVYNPTRNNAIDPLSKRQAFVDFAEITTDKDLVRKNIEERLWLEKESYKWELPQVLKKTFKNEMDKAMTVENLDEYWNDAIYKARTKIPILAPTNLNM